MADRVVRGTWWMLVMGFIGLAAMAAVYASYWGVAELIARRWESGVGALVVALVTSGATWITCRLRTDLLYG